RPSPSLDRIYQLGLWLAIFFAIFHRLPPNKFLRFRRTFHQFRSGWLCYFCYSSRRRRLQLCGVSRFHPLRAMQTRDTAVGSTSRSRLLRSGSAGARLPAVPCDDKGKGAGDESFNQAAAVCFRAHHQRRGVRHHDRDPALRIEVMPGYSAVLVLAVFGMGEVVALAQSNYTGQPLWSPELTHARARISL